MSRVGPSSRLVGTVGIAVLLFVSVIGFALADTLPPGGSFLDDDGNIHEGSIEAIAAAGITKGCNPPVNDLYCPSDRVNRGQMAAFLTRALGLTDRLDDPFTDDDGSVFEADIERMAAAGITKGCNPPVNDLFCPQGYVTRGQMAAFLVRALGYTDAGTGDLFVDDDGSIFEADIDRLGTAGVTRGCNPPINDQFCPNSPVLRDQMASFLTRALNLTPIIPPPPTSSTTTTTTVPGNDHPQSGDGWEFLGCSSPTGTCAYPQTTTESQVRIDNSLLPPNYCIPDPFEPWKCIVDASQWTFYWYDSGGVQVLPTSCSFSYNGGFLESVTCKMPIAGAPLGEYRGELCRTEYPSSTCVETLLTVYFEIT
jgi:hypothetical protein